MADWMLTDTSKVTLWSDDAKPPDQDAACMAAARVLALAANTCDPEPLVRILAEEVSFDSQSRAGPINGRSAVAEFFRGKFDAIRSSDRYPVAEVGRIDGGHRNEPGVIVFQAGAVRIFWSPSVDANGLVTGIFGYTLVPHPSTARGTGERPGFDEDAYRRREERRLVALKIEFGAAKGPITFRGFALTPTMASERLEPMLARLTAAFPGSASTVSIHAWSDRGRGETIAEEASIYDVSGYPAIAVEKDGTVFRGASEGRFSFEEVAAFVGFLLGRP
jgi:hypothetical protein